MCWNDKLDLYVILIFFNILTHFLSLVLGILMSAVSLIVLRYRHPNRERPIRIPIAIPILFIIILSILIIASAITDIENIGTSLILLSTAIPAYVFGVMWKNKPASFNRQYNSFALLLQKLFHVVHDEHRD